MHVLSGAITLAWLALAVASASYTISKTKIAVPFRNWARARNAWLGDLVSCPYCVSHYLAAIAVLLYRPRVVNLLWVFDIGVAWLATITVSALIVGKIHLAIKGLQPPPPPPPPPPAVEVLGLTPS